MEDEIRSAVKSGDAIIGYRETAKFLKSGGGAKMLVVAGNIPADMGEELRRDAKAAGARLEEFPGTSKDLGTACGKPFPVTTVAIKG